MTARRPGTRAAALAALLLLAACGPREAPPPPAQTGPGREVVEELEQALLRAMLRADTAALSRLWAPEYVSTSAVGHTTTRAEGLMAYAVGLVHVDSAAITDLDVRGYGHTAVALGLLHWRGTAAGGPFAGTARFLHVWAHQADGVWRLTASQLTTAPPTRGGGRP